MKKYCFFTFFFFWLKIVVKTFLKTFIGPFFQEGDGAVSPSGQNSRHHLFALLQQVVSTRNSSNADRSLKGKINRIFKHMKLEWYKIRYYRDFPKKRFTDPTFPSLHFGQNENVADSESTPSKTPRKIIFHRKNVSSFIVMYGLKVL